MKDREQRRAAIGAAFLLAAAAAGPSLMIQLPRFGAQIGLPFLYAILFVTLADIAAKANIWAIVGASGLTGAEIADRVKKGLGAVLSAIVAFGGLAFNVGNIGGTALGLNALFGLPERIGALIGAAAGVLVLCLRGAKRAVDLLSVLLSGIIVGSMLAIAIRSHAPVLDAIAAVPSWDTLPSVFVPLITLLGLACGGYIPFSGAHRLLESGGGSPLVFRRAAVLGASVSGLIRILLFFGVMGVCFAGKTWMQDRAASILASDNPMAQTFALAAGIRGRRLFGVALFASGLGCVIGAAYTSVSFLKTLHPYVRTHERAFMLGHIVCSALILLIFGNAARFALLAGAINGVVLPLSLGCILLVAHRRDVVGSYRHPPLLTAAGWLIVLLSLILAVYLVVRLFV